MGRHRGTRPRYRRISAAATATVVTAIAVLGGTGVLPTQRTPSTVAQIRLAGDTGDHTSSTQTHATPGLSADGKGSTTPPVPAQSQRVASPSALPGDSGQGKRIVFDISGQRVWLVSAEDAVVRTYLVSGSLTHNLAPGEYSVFSRSRWAVGVDDSGVMQYFVRFAHGKNAAIGFHDIPTKNGEFLQTQKQLGTPQSHGCIRQWRPDAKVLWHFAPVGTTVDVLA